MIRQFHQEDPRLILYKIFKTFTGNFQENIGMEFENITDTSSGFMKVSRRESYKESTLPIKNNTKKLQKIKMNRILNTLIINNLCRPHTYTDSYLLAEKSFSL